MHLDVRPRIAYERRFSSQEAAYDATTLKVVDGTAAVSLACFYMHLSGSICTHFVRIPSAHRLAGASGEAEGGSGDCLVTTLLSCVESCRVWLLRRTSCKGCHVRPWSKLLRMTRSQWLLSSLCIYFSALKNAINVSLLVSNNAPTPPS